MEQNYRPSADVKLLAKWIGWVINIGANVAYSIVLLRLASEDEAYRQAGI